MDDNDNEIEKLVLTRVMQMNAVIVGLICGIILGGVVFLATNFLILKGGSVVGPHLALLGEFFIGYTVTFVGSLIGLCYGFVLGFVLGYAFSHLYNFVANFREKTRA